jgi:hypothetical protein
MDKLKTEAERWWLVNLAVSFMQTCIFTVWTVVLMVIIDAPPWGWSVAVVYAITTWFAFLSWVLSNTTLRKWKESVVDDAASKESCE